MYCKKMIYIVRANCRLVQPDGSVACRPSIEHDPFPTIFFSQHSGIAFCAILHTKFYKIEIVARVTPYRVDVVENCL